MRPTLTVHARAVATQDIKNLHDTFERMGKNSLATKDLFGRQFVVPVDSEHKATQDPLATTLCVCAKPHMAAFHTSWFGFFSSFYSTFAAAALYPYIKPDLDLSPAEWGISGNMAVGGTIFFRLAMGWICDTVGARKGLGYLLLGTMPAIVWMMFVSSAAEFIICRCVIGFSLATFVACQTWCAQMFSKSVVGIANATAAGWGNLGGGVTNLTMPFVFLIMMSFTDNDESASWRLSYFVPLAFHLVGGLSTLFLSQDLPDGNFKELEAIKAKQPSKSGVVLKVGFSNINAWLLTVTYGMCFGIELTMNNVAAKYFYAYQGFTPQMAGIAASCWGLMNLFARSMGGWLSDWANKKGGMRGRLWACWIVQTIEGVFCIFLGAVTIGFDAPNLKKSAPKIESWVELPEDPVRLALGMPNGWVNLNKTCPGLYPEEPKDFLASPCNTLNLKINKAQALKDCLALPNSTVAVLRQTAPPHAGGPAEYNCVSNSGTAGIVMLLVVCFSLCLQMAEGLHYGIVPYVCRPALGVTSGMIGAGGNAGAVIAGSIFFTGNFRLDQGIINMGIMIICETALLMFVYFPETGSMFFGPGGLGSYDPQVIKPPEGYVGADVIDFAAAAAHKRTDTTTDGGVQINKA